MAQRIAELSIDEFEALVERAVDRRLRLWLVQMMDALTGAGKEDETDLSDAFAAAALAGISSERMKDELAARGVEPRLGPATVDEARAEFAALKRSRNARAD
jgi:hypothetical protein